MSTTTAEHDATEDHGHGSGPAAEGAENPGGQHESAEERDKKERLALWLFIGGDFVFLALEVFAWFYLRTLNTNGLWNAAKCTKDAGCVDGLGNPLVGPIPKAAIWHPIVILGLTVVSALLVWMAESAARNKSAKGAVSGAAFGALAFMLAAIALQIYQFQVLPFTTIQGAFPSVYEFFMGSTLAHLLLMAFILMGLWMRASKGRYAGGTWHRVRLIRIFAVWIAISTGVLAIVGSFFV
jgi:heme/copper-type cytochrome/quinol oxidase subunit 3